MRKIYYVSMLIFGGMLFASPAEAQQDKKVKQRLDGPHGKPSFIELSV